MSERTNEAVSAGDEIVAGQPKPALGQSETTRRDQRRSNLDDISIALPFEKSAGTFALRLLIGLYIVVGLFEAGMAALIGSMAFRVVPDHIAKKRAQDVEETLLIAALALLTACLPLIAAYGLWRRWRLLRLILIGLSIWTLALCSFAAVVAIGQLAGLTDGRILGTNDPPAETLALAAGCIAFAVVQWWILTRPAARQTRPRIEPAGELMADGRNARDEPLDV